MHWIGVGGVDQIIVPSNTSHQNIFNEGSDIFFIVHKELVFQLLQHRNFLTNFRFWPDFDQILEFEISMWNIFLALTCLGKDFHKELSDYISLFGRYKVFSVHPIRIRTNWVFSPFLKMSMFSTTSDKDIEVQYLDIR